MYVQYELIRYINVESFNGEVYHKCIYHLIKVFKSVYHTSLFDLTLF